jgi:hypothetical protein
MESSNNPPNGLSTLSSALTETRFEALKALMELLLREIESLQKVSRAEEGRKSIRLIYQMNFSFWRRA